MQYDSDWKKKRFGCYNFDILHMNVSRTQMDRSTQSHLTGVTIGFLTVFVLVTNIMFIHGLVKTNRKKLTLAHKLFIYMSSVDLLNGFLAMPMLAVFALRGFNCLAMSIMVSLGTFSTLASTFTLLSLSVIRLRSITDPFKPRNGKRLTVGVIIQGVVSAGFTAVLFENYLQENPISFLIPILVSISALMLSLQISVVSCNIFSLVYLRRQRNKRNQHRLQPSRNSTGANTVQFQDIQLKNHHKAATTLLLISVSLGMCISVQSCLAIIVFAKVADNEIRVDGFMRTMDLSTNLRMIVDLNSGMNAFICLCRSRKIQNYYKHCLVSVFSRE